VRQAEKLPGAEMAEPAPVPIEDAHYNHVVKLLKKGSKRSLPHTRAKLQKHVASMLNGKGVDEHVPNLIKRMFKDGFVEEIGKELSYPTVQD
jgi:hypothetical protein